MAAADENNDDFDLDELRMLGVDGAAAHHLNEHSQDNITAAAFERIFDDDLVAEEVRAKAVRD